MKQDEDDADKDEALDEIVAALYGSDEYPHGDREERGQHGPQHENDPPHDREGAVRLRQHGEKLALVPRA